MPALIPVDNTLGAALLGAILSAVVYGITCLQVFIYYTEQAADDHRLLRIFVGILMGLDTFHFTLVTHSIYFFAVTNFGDYVRDSRTVWSLQVQVGTAQLLTLLVQGCFAYRIYTLSQRKNWWLPVLVILCGFAMLLSSTGFMITAFHVKYFTATTHNIPWTISGLLSELLGDTLMTAGMIYYLSRGRTVMERTNRVLNILITYTLNSGLLTTVFTILTLAVFLRYEKTMLYAPFFFILARLYSCAFMSTLNSRNKIRATLAGGSRGVAESYSLSNIGTMSASAQPLEYKVESHGDKTTYGNIGLGSKMGASHDSV